MKPQHFAMLAIAAALSLAAAIASYTASKPWSLGAQGGGKLFPALVEQAANVATIEVTRGEETVSVARDGQAWVLKSNGGFPASVEKVRAFLISLAEADLAEPKTTLPERYALLDLGDPKAKGATSRLIRLLDGNGAVIAEAIVGKTRPEAFGTGKSGTYVRRPDEAQTWLIDTEISGGTTLNDWIKAIAFETAADKIAKLTVSIEGAEPYVIDRGADGSAKLADMPAGKKLKFVNALDGIIESASYVPFESVRKAAEGTGGAPAGTIAIEGPDGLKVEIKVRRDKDTWLSITASGEGASKPVADAITARTAGWDFKIVPSKADGLLKKRDDLLEDSSS